VDGADEAAAVASVCGMYYGGAFCNDALHNGGETLAMAGVAAAEVIETLPMYARLLLLKVRLLQPQRLVLLMLLL
jgi:hypothetical protein